MFNRSSSSRRSGFSLLEIIVAVSVLAILAGVVTMRSGALIEKGRAQNVIQTIDALRNACAQYQTDTGQLAFEYAGYPVASRRLSGTQTLAGWAGPYIDAPFTTTGNPWGGITHLYGTVTANGWISGFDVDADGTDDVTGPGNMLYLTLVTASAAQRIDQVIDKGMGADWRTAGRVRYDAAAQRLLVLVHY